MRLINVDALIEDLEYDIELDARALDDADLLIGINRDLAQFDKDCKQNAVDMLKKAPTVDAEPIRHGRWIEDGSFKYKHGGRNSEAKELFGTEWRTMRRIKCSLCNKITLVDDTILYEYCPHCGAKMDVEQKKSYFPKGFFSKERPLAKGDKHDSD